ncbi:BQ2448_2578 [Microbotryum intermedium]|uniref:Presequence translocated-associated motor subunit PAM17 n=1 Tax=Microbotryum intermedium TaxID=269621 RepID=A0A238FEJ8_9BASI|nr:BQ2448_2578 [Microbotryum intermedium]
MSISRTNAVSLARLPASRLVMSHPAPLFRHLSRAASTSSVTSTSCTSLHTALMKLNTCPMLTPLFLSSATQQLTWPKYLSLRRSQRLYGLLASVPTTFAGLTLGASYFATIEAEPTDLILGLEPVYAYGIATMACVALGWLSGPIVGTALWRLTHRKVLQAMEVKEKDFYAHIARNRVDPSRQSVSNPVPDYYAEKVSSLSGYRQWLRDQNVYRRKATFGEGQDGVM